MSERIEVLFSEEEVDARIAAMGQTISEDYAGKSIHLITILSGGAQFSCELAKRIKVPVTMDYLAITPFGAETRTNASYRIIKDLSTTVKGKNVLIAEDIIDSGRTISWLLKLLKDREPDSIRIAALLDKPIKRTAGIRPDYTGFQITDEFVVGYGFDYDQKYRNLPYIGQMKFDF